MAERLRAGFPVPNRPDGCWGQRLTDYGAPQGNAVGCPGSCELLGVTGHDVSLVGPRRGVVGTASYGLRTLPDRAALEGVLGAAEVEVYDHHGRSSEVAETWRWEVGDDVSVTVSVYGAPRDESVAGLFLSCGDARLARPFLPSLTADAPWRSRGTVQPLAVEGLEPCALDDSALALSRPGLLRPAPWAREGLWRSREWWGVADGAVTCAVRNGAPVEVVLFRLLPARGPGGSWLQIDGDTVLSSSQPRGLDGVSESLEAWEIDVQVIEDRDV